MSERERGFFIDFLQSRIDSFEENLLILFSDRTSVYKIKLVNNSSLTGGGASKALPLAEELLATHGC